LIATLFPLLLSAATQAEPEKMVGRMLMVGFYGTSVSASSPICQDIRRYDLAGVILFDFNPTDSSKPKNIATKAQLAQLTKELQRCSPRGDLLISVDQEGGKVQRLKSKYGFYGKYASARSISGMGDSTATDMYTKMASELKGVGINYNLAPVVDMALNPKNKVIFALGRSYGSSGDTVARYAKIFIDSMHHKGVLTSLKHFPGHGSSTGDTHKGFVDVTAQWSSLELDPYKILFKKANIDTVMIAHVFNKKIDSSYPATLSRKTIQGLLRGEMGYNGVTITDDLQMGAIAHKYGLAQTLGLSINAGNDILLFGNQLNPRSVVSTKKLVDTVIHLVNTKQVSLSTIKASNARVAKLKRKL